MTLPACVCGGGGGGGGGGLGESQQAKRERSGIHNMGSLIPLNFTKYELLEHACASKLSSPSPFASLLGHSGERWVEAVDVVVPLAGVTGCHEVSIRHLLTHSTLR